MMIDIVFLVLMLVAILKGLTRGLIVSIFSLLAVIIGLAAAIKLSAVVAGHLKNSLQVSARWLPILAFVLVFIVVVLLVRWCANLIQAAVNFAWLGWLNKLGGVILYALIFTAAYSIFLFYGSASGVLSKHAIDASIVYKYVEPFGPAVINGLAKAIPLFKDMFSSLKDFFGHFAKQVAS
ncbi:MAG TPA: CvpA family protein [Puia sp.]|nr:CvpA family protein [Puia sp.]